GVSEMAHNVKKSDRGEYEITSLNDMYLQNELLHGIVLGRGFAWLDTGTMDSLLEAAEFVQMLEKRQGVKISAIEEIAYRRKWINKKTLLEAADKYGKSPYGDHLKNVAEGKIL
ncbi:MAG: glucose-1-phosphate thymidylyltransferase, partial [Clostridiales bacterium]|nr:glucose-1-phosphate thymidylyltransferase [Clostridiales bacterium]